jgi:hypothetical protein
MDEFQEINRIPAAKLLFDTGLLFEINRRILHPFGLAMEILYDDQGGALSEEDAVITMSQNIWDYRNDPEGVLYEPVELITGSEKFKRFLDTFGAAKLKKRAELLGFTIQAPAIENIPNKHPLIEEDYKKIDADEVVSDSHPLIKKNYNRDSIDEVTEDQIEEIKKKNNVRRSQKSISDKIKESGIGLGKNSEVNFSNPSEEPDKMKLKKIKKYIGKEHSKLGKPGQKCVSTIENTESISITGGSPVVMCIGCGQTLRDPDLEN